MNDEPPPIPSVPHSAKKGLSTGCIVGLVLGVVALLGIAVIGVLAALAVPAAAGVMKKAKLVRTQAALRDLTLGVKNYQVEFNRYPGAEGEAEVSGALLQVLLGHNADGLNPRQVRFIEPPKANRGVGGLMGAEGAESLTDIWGHPYRLAMDTDGDGKLADPEHPGAALDRTIITWSAGEDGDFATWGDNVKSW